MGSITAQLMLVTLLSKCSGLFREMIFGATFGTSMIKDIYVIAESIAAVLFSFLFLAIQSCFIPMYNRIRAESGRPAADRFTANLTNILLVLTTVIIAFAVIFMEPIVHVMAAGYTGERFVQTVYFARIEMFSLYFMAMNACMISYLNIHDDFSTPATTGIIMNAVLILFAVLSAKTGSMLLLALGTIVATGCQYIFFPRALKRVHYRHRPILQFHDEHIKSVLKLAIPIMLSIVVQDVSIIIDKTVASTVATEGGVSALDYAVKLYQLVYGIIIVSIVTAVFPQMSRFGQNRQVGRVKKLLTRSIVSGLVLVIPAAVGMMIFAAPIVRLFFERGAFTPESTAMTAGALFWYSPCLIALVFSSLGTRAFYSIGDTRTPVRISMGQVVLNIIFNLIFSRFFGINGLAAATSLSLSLGAAATMMALRRKIGRIHLRAIAGSCRKILLITIPMGILARGVYALLVSTSFYLALFCAVLFAVLFYGIAILFARIPEIRHMVNDAYHKLTRRTAARR